MKPVTTMILCAAATMSLPGCAVYNVARLPVQATSKAVDWATVSGEEADRERGRDLKKKCKQKHDDYYCKD